VIAPNFQDQCLAAGIPFFFKQWGGFNKKKAGRLLDGRKWDDVLGIASTNQGVRLALIIIFFRTNVSFSA